MRATHLERISVSWAPFIAVVRVDVVFVFVFVMQQGGCAVCVCVYV